jgi:streptomycin 6-kinase
VVGPVSLPDGQLVPGAFARETIAREGPAGRLWIESLPDRVARLMDRWALDPDGPVMHGYIALVIPVTQCDLDCILKVSWIYADSEAEADALRAWDGRGAVRLYDEDRDEGALLLERLDAGTTLESLPPDRAMEIAGRLLRRLAIPAPDWARPLPEIASEMRDSLEARWAAHGRPFDRRVLEVSFRLLDELGPGCASLLVNSDLHYQNVLAGERAPWLAIDPKVVAGDPEFGVAPLLWQRFGAIRDTRELDRRMTIVCRAADLREARAYRWSYVRIVDYWLWAVELGYTEDPARCARLLRLLDSRLAGALS